MPVHVVTTDLQSGAPAWWSDRRSGRDPDRLGVPSRRVPAGPGWDRRLHVDGGVLCPVPVGRALSLGAHRVWVLDVCSGRPPQLPDHPSALDVLLNSFALARRALRAEAPDDRRPGQEVVTIEAELPDMDVRDFSRTTELMAIGLAAGRDRVGVRTSPWANRPRARRLAAAVA